MKYRFILSYNATGNPFWTTRVCRPLYGDDLAIHIDRANGEWYYTRKLNGKLTFVRDDYDWIMAQTFDGTYELTIKQSGDNGTTWNDYFYGTFSRASMEIDEDHRTATLDGLTEGIYDAIENGKDEEYDLRKIIPDSEMKEIHGKVPPALALVDEFREYSKVDMSDIYCGMDTQSGGYIDDVENFWGLRKDMRTNPNGRLMGILAEAKINCNSPYYDGIYAGTLTYTYSSVTTPSGDVTRCITIPCGTLRNKNNARLNINIGWPSPLPQFPTPHISVNLDNTYYGNTSSITPVYVENSYYTPLLISVHLSSINIDVIIKLHYIYASLLLKEKTSTNLKNILNVGPYYEGMEVFNGIDLDVRASYRTVEQSNGHRIVPGTADYGGIPQYFAPPAELSPYGTPYIPLNEDNWDYASLWYTVVPTEENGLLDPDKYGDYTWSGCLTVGTCLKYLLAKITGNAVVLAETSNYSRFLFDAPNPVEDHEQFSWLVTQKSNVMHPSSQSAARCIVRLKWFLELLRNAFNCYYWLEKTSNGQYNFHVEHVEYFRHGGAYGGDLPYQMDLTLMRPRRNFIQNSLPAKHFADLTNKYSFDLDDMTEKYTFSWQGDGGSDDFKGNPMFFRAGWVEKNKSEDHQVDNIFADLPWLMLNAGTDTASSKNYDGLFLFGGYRPFDNSQWKENKAALSQYITNPLFDDIDIFATIPSGQTVYIEKVINSIVTVEATYTGTGEKQLIQMRPTSGASNVLYRVNFGSNYANVIIHRAHIYRGNSYYVANCENLLRPGNHIQNGNLAWPWLQNEYLHYDIPAANWSYDSDDKDTATYLDTGTIKMVKKQSVPIVPIPDASTEMEISDIMGVKTGLGLGIIDSAKVNLSSRNAELTLIYDIN